VICEGEAAGVHVLRRTITLSFIQISTSWLCFFFVFDQCFEFLNICMLGDVSFLGRSRAIPLIDFIMGGGGNDGDGDWAVLPCPPLAEVTLALVGKIGTGKSATANCMS
jgi:hypothetical protein